MDAYMITSHIVFLIWHLEFNSKHGGKSFLSYKVNVKLLIHNDEET